MLSICIPIYNFNCTALLNDLIVQSENLGVPVEICCIDDASTHHTETNQAFIRDTSIKYEALKKNIGRSKIRNRLAKRSQFPNLLYLDCDVEIGSAFLNNYKDYLDQNRVVYGGTSYPLEKPENSTLLLHYQVGQTKESLSQRERERSPYLTFKTNNFLTPRSLILKYPLDESVSGYGHEDTLWAFTLKELEIPILHIQNPIIHQGLESSQILIGKIESSLDNLIKLHKAGKHIPVKVFEVYQHYRPFFKLIAKSGLPGRLRNKLISRRASLRSLDWYKLMYLAQNDVS